MSHNETARKFKQLSEEADELIKAGQIGQVSNLINDMNFAKVPRDYHRVFAKICRRAGLIGQGLRLMHPIIRQNKIVKEPATANEICEYSALLTRNGSTQEAISLLEKVDAIKAPEASLYLGFCHIVNWDYGKSVDYLNRFLDSDPDNYSKLIAQVNLAASYIVVSKLTEAAELLERTIQLAGQMGANRLIGNCFELWGQVYFWQGDFTKARNSLNRALEIFGQSQSYDQLLIYKTQSIMTALEQNRVDPLIRFREEAVRRKHWECVRESDLFQLKIQFDQKKLDHLVHGTPMWPYRQRIQQIVGAEPSEYYILGNESSKCLDIKSGCVDGKAMFPRGKKIHQVLASLLRDFYVPRNVGTLFAELYPGEYFNVDSSPFRVRQVMMRARQWLKENRVRVSLDQSEGSYRLTVKEDFGIKIWLETPSIDPMTLKWNEFVRSLNGEQSFSAEEACQQMRWSRSNFRRFVDWALHEGKLQKYGVGKSTYYQFTSQEPIQNGTAKAS